MHTQEHSEKTKRKISEVKKGKRCSIETEFKKGKPSWNKGIKLSGDHIIKLSESHKGQISWNKGKKCPQISKGQIGRKRPDMEGENNWNWKGGITPELKLLRSIAKYQIWRNAVFLRDNFTCQDCGLRSGNGKAVHLEAHHIKSFAECSGLRFDINNGITYCVGCHVKNDGFRRIKNVA
ncbi:hypothetical protein LCGC14_2094870 [marine sediment metagenome]|uniref:HNH nuclease domain-containing protein n=1 Tax=marine sediment metagenome TaxID=412755 RepID=A0A0F9GPS0_9ZZZZ